MPTPAALSWWHDARFGMFIHWGLYSLLARTTSGRCTRRAFLLRNTVVLADELRSPALQPRRMGGAGRGRRHALHDSDFASPRGLQPLGLPGLGLHGSQDRRQARPAGRVRQTPARSAACATASTTPCWTGATRPTSAARPAIRWAGRSSWTTYTRRCWNCAPTTAISRCSGTTAAGRTRPRTGTQPRSTPKSGGSTPTSSSTTAPCSRRTSTRRNSTSRPPRIGSGKAA